MSISHTCKIILGVWLALTVIFVTAQAEKIDDVIRYFYEDFGRLAPYELAQQYKTKIKKISGLDISNTFSIETKSRGELRKEFKKLTADQSLVNNEDEHTALEFVLRLHGFLKKEEAYSRSLFHHSYDELSGFYDIENKKMVLLETDNPLQIEHVLLHEMVHAGQDDYIDLKKFYLNENLSLDEFFAKVALLEGQAEALGYLDSVFKLEYDYDANKLMRKFDDWLANINSDSENSFETFKSFPYSHGLVFVLEQYLIREIHDFKHMMDNMPSTTEQILHPSKYTERESKRDTKLESFNIASLDTEKLLETTFGEFYILQMLSNIIPDNHDANRSVAAGWGGDYLVVLRDHHELTAIWELVWDTRDDAIEFYNMYKNHYLEKLHSDNNNLLFAQNIVLSKQENRVLVFSGDIANSKYQQLFSALSQ